MQDLEYQIERAAGVMAMLGNPVRLLVLCKLVDGERSVSELVTQTGMSQSALSQHLAKMRHFQLVKTRRSAQTVYYALNGHEVSTLLKTLHGLYCENELRIENETEEVLEVQ